MYAITKIYRVDRSTIHFYDTTEITPEEIQKNIDLGTTIYLAVENSDTETTVAIDYSKLITDTTLGQYASWDEVANRFTDEYVNGYTATLPGYLPGTETASNPIQIWDAMNTLNTFNLDYGDYITDRHGILPYMYNLPDLRINLYEGATTHPNLQNSIPIVNGFICRPVYREDKSCLYALDGARLCWQSGVHRTPEVQLVDFSLIGDVSIHPLYLEAPTTEHDGFTVSFASRTNQFDFDADWILTSKYDLREYTPIVVIGGVAILPDKIKTFNNYSCKFAINTYPWDISLVYKKYLVDESSTSAQMFFNSTAIERYVKSQMTRQGTSKDTFVILVHTPKIYVSRMPLDVWQNGITINLYTTEGLLLHDKTATLRVYHCDTYSDRKELILQNMEEVYAADNHFRQSQLAFIHPDCQHINFENLHSSNCTMIHMMR